MGNSLCEYALKHRDVPLYVIFGGLGGPEKKVQDLTMAADLRSKDKILAYTWP